MSHDAEFSVAFELAENPVVRCYAAGTDGTDVHVAEAPRHGEAPGSSLICKWVSGLRHMGQWYLAHTASTMFLATSMLLPDMLHIIGYHMAS